VSVGLAVVIVALLLHLCEGSAEEEDTTC
jgi:hypothetical protein